MDFIWDSITDWLKEILISGIVSNLSGMFDSTNEQVGNIVGQVGMTPQSWNRKKRCRPLSQRQSAQIKRRSLLRTAFRICSCGRMAFVR